MKYKKPMKIWQIQITEISQILDCWKHTSPEEVAPGRYRSVKSYGNRG